MYIIRIELIHRRQSYCLISLVITLTIKYTIDVGVCIYGPISSVP